MKQRSIVAILFVTGLMVRGDGASPLPPDQERASFRLADDRLTIELVAAEPDVRAPVAVAWDADGRMFVAEMTDYPSGPVSGRIRLLEDRDGDGRYERATVFASNIAFPNGVMAWKNGVLVTAAPDIWFLADTNGDGIADVREKILTGFAEGNQQLRVNGLYWGIDNWIYGANGRSDGEVRWADGSPAGSIRRHDFRFRPDTKQFEAIAGNSQFGMGHDDWGNRFPVFNAIPIRHVVLEEGYLARQPALAGTDVVPSISPTNDGNRVFSLTPPTLLIPQPVGFFTSACGPGIYRGTTLPDSYRGNYFVCEPVQNVVQRRLLKPSGSTFVAEYAHTNQEFLASTDRWFHGVFTATGPDGAFYIVDFYRDLVEHPHWVAPELRDKIDWRKGEEHGRIWRVRTKEVKLAKVEKLSGASNNGLVRALEIGNGWTRDTAQRLLIERHARDVVPALETLARQGAKAQGRVQALNVLALLNARNNELYVSALRDADPAVRTHAIRLLEQEAIGVIKSASTAAILKQLVPLAADSDARVRLQLAASLGVVANNDIQLNALARIAQNAGTDSWQGLAVLSSAGSRPWLLGEKLKPLLNNATDAQLALLERLAGLVAAGTNSTDSAAMFKWLRESSSPNRFVLLASAIDATPAKRRATLGASFSKESTLTAAADKKLAERARVAAVRFAAARQEEGMFGELAALVTPSQPESVQLAAARALLEANNADGARLALARWRDCPKTIRRQMIAIGARQSRSAMALLDAVERDLVPLVEIDPSTRQTLQRSADASVKERAVMLFGSTASPDRDAIVEKYRVSLKLPGDRARGALVFEKNCSVCHQMQGVGAKVGPDLSGIGQHARETLLVDILDPSRQVLPDFVSYNATTKTGDTYTGFIANESATTVTLRRPNEPDITLPRAELKEFGTSGKSVMPDGLEASMSQQDLADLIEFLRRPDRTLFTQTK